MRFLSRPPEALPEKHEDPRSSWELLTTDQAVKPAASHKPACRWMARLKRLGCSKRESI
jgi:hypothetical protein